MDFYLTAYAQLSSCRNADGAVPWDVIDRYAVRYGFEGDLYDFFVSAIFAMDRHFIEQGPKAGGEPSA